MSSRTSYRLPVGPCEDKDKDHNDDTADRFGCSVVIVSHSWTFWVGALVLIGLLFWLIPRNASGRVWIIFGVFVAGFLGGHVFW